MEVKIRKYKTGSWTKPFELEWLKALGFTTEEFATKEIIVNLEIADGKLIFSKPRINPVVVDTATPTA